MKTEPESTGVDCRTDRGLRVDCKHTHSAYSVQKAADASLTHTYQDCATPVPDVIPSGRNPDIHLAYTHSSGRGECEASCVCSVLVCLLRQVFDAVTLAGRHMSLCLIHHFLSWMSIDFVIVSFKKLPLIITVELIRPHISQLGHPSVNVNMCQGFYFYV